MLVQQHGADHAAPADQSRESHLSSPLQKLSGNLEPRSFLPGMGETNRADSSGNGFADGLPKARRPRRRPLARVPTLVLPFRSRCPACAALTRASCSTADLIPVGCLGWFRRSGHQQASGQDCSQRVCEIPYRRCRARCRGWPVQAPLLVPSDAEGSMPIEPVSIAASSDRDVAEHVAGDHARRTSSAPRPAASRRCRRTCARARRPGTGRALR